MDAFVAGRIRQMDVHLAALRTGMSRVEAVSDDRDGLVYAKDLVSHALRVKEAAWDIEKYFCEGIARK